ncbi:MAG: MFS transporter, partial [Chlamydiota bacterium]
PNHIYGVLAVLGSCVILGGLAWPLCTSLISNLAPRQFQGKILGVSQSVQSLAMTLAPVVGGVAFQISWELPFLIGAGASLLAAVLYFTLKDR